SSRRRHTRCYRDWSSDVCSSDLKLKLPWQVFAMGIDSYKVLPEWGAEVAARTLPWAELLIGLLLIAGRLMRLSSAVTSALLVVRSEERRVGRGGMVGWWE